MEKTVNKNSKSLLSRLLATENIFVIHDKNAKTASFDIMNRVLRLPILKEMSEELYDMFVAHEVAHALYTPFTEEDKKTLKEHGYLSSAIKVCGNTEEAALAHGYMNVVEDARIERLIKEKFAGLRRDFFIAYGELHKKDFFKIKGKDVQEMSFIDRINLFFKIGSHVNIAFTDEEMTYVLMVENTRTFDDVIDVTKKIWEYSKDKKREQTGGSDIGHEHESDGSDNEDGEESRKESSQTQNGDSKEKGGEFVNGEWHTRSIRPDECHTQQNFDERVKSLISDSIYEETSYFALPSVNTKNVVVNFNEILSMFDKCATDYTKKYSEFMDDSKKFVESSNRVVNILAQEFMARKAAKDHHRSSVNRTGVIDTVRMVDHKFCDDIFKRLKFVQKGKSHGLVFYVDLSGSMAPVLEDTFKQLVQLVLFCRRVNIPFEVYGFTTKMRDGLEMDNYSIDKETLSSLSSSHWTYSKVPNEMKESVNPFTLMNLFSSKMTKNQTEVMIRNVFALSTFYKRGEMYSIPSMMYLSSTPLIEAVVASIDMVRKFKEDNKLDIVNTIFMTDGEPTGVRLPCHNTFVYKEGMTFKFEHRSSVLDNMIKIFRELTGMKAICFFLCENKYTLNAWTYGSSNHSESNQLAEEASKRYAKEGWVSAMKNSHKYDEKFIIRAQNAVEDADLDDVLSTKTTSVSIRNGFIKAMSQTKTSRTMLNRFIELISKE
jgi:hypothetical protein